MKPINSSHHARTHKTTSILSTSQVQLMSPLIFTFSLKGSLSFLFYEPGTIKNGLVLCVITINNVRKLDPSVDTDKSATCNIFFSLGLFLSSWIKSGHNSSIICLLMNSSGLPILVPDKLLWCILNKYIFCFILAQTTQKDSHSRHEFIILFYFVRSSFFFPFTTRNDG